MSVRDFDESLTCLQKVPDHRRQEVLTIVGRLLRHDAAIFTWQELLRFAQRESLTPWELAGAIEYCWLCGWCGYDPRTGAVLGGYMEALRTDGAEQDQLIEGRLGR